MDRAPTSCSTVFACQCKEWFTSSVVIHGLQFHYRLEGTDSRPVIVLSNSLGTNLSMWDSQVPALAEKFRVLRYDTRGHGRSGVPAGPYTIEMLGRDVVALLDRLDIERAHFCGLSMGGMTGLWLGIHHPERFPRLVLCNTAARVGTPDLWNARIVLVRKGGLAAITGAVLERWFTPEFAGSAPQTIDSVRNMLLESPADGYIACCEALRDADLREEADGVRAPTLVIAGSRDPATPPADGRLLASKIPGARYLELESSHLSNIEAAPRFTSALLDFLEAH